MTHPLRAMAAAVVALTAAFAPLLAPPAPAMAHPLGNFTVNRYDGLRLTPDRIEDFVAVDTAEIPTAQDRAATDTDRDGQISDGEAAARAVSRCGELASGVTALLAGSAVPPWQVTGSSLHYRSGTAGLPTARLTCTLQTVVDLTRSTALSFNSGASVDRVGWKEITAVGDGVGLSASSVPAQSMSDLLRNYPSDLMDRPPAVVTADLRTQPTTGNTAAPHTRPGTIVSISNEQGVFSVLEHRLSALIGTRDLTFVVGVLAVGLALLLGVGHAALPGHAKLAMAACLAQQKRGVRAAVGVGATVTATHTAGVLIVGLVLTASMSLVGEQVLGWLEAVGGALIAAVGVGLAVSAIRSLRGHDHHGHHDHHDGRGHSTVKLASLLGVGLAAGLVPSPSALVILLGAMAMGNTWFGVLLVLGYGAGMALTLAAVGMILASGTRPATHLARRLPGIRRYAPYGAILTAAAVLTVGLGLTLRSLVGIG